MNRSPLRLAPSRSAGGLAKIQWLISVASLALLCCLGGNPTAVRAAIIVNAQQVGADVAVTLTGSFNTNIAPFSTGNYYEPSPLVLGGNQPTNGFFFSSGLLSGQKQWIAFVKSVPFSSFGSGTATSTYASSYSISGVGAWVRYEPYTGQPELYLSPSYTGWALNESMTFTNRTMSSLGLSNYGSYVFTFSDYSGNNITDSVTVNLINPVPEPSTYAMALAGIACGGFSMWRRRKRA